MSVIILFDMPIHEKSLLKNLGIDEDSEGLNKSEFDQWEWISFAGNSFNITDRIDLLTLSTDSDDWYFCRLKFQNSDDYAYVK